MGKITKLKTLTGVEIGAWYDSTGTYDVFPDCRRNLADWGDCALSEIDFEGTEGGDFFTINGEPVAYLEWRFTPSRPVNRVVDLRPMLAAE